ncbi:MAG: flavodoxin family protein [Ruminococcaceae bacterium]|nr:flavodoxin family protein [Oscillospiraceae bacterium]
MKILVINGSPKRGKSDTMHITRAFLDGMQEAAAQDITLINIIDKHIEYCTGCFACMHNGGSCIHNDDMKEILEEILKSDLLILSYPLYCYGMPAPLKAMMDRTLPLSSMAMQKVGDRYEHVGQADFSHLGYVMICGCGFPNSKQNFEPAAAQFKLMFPNNHTVITVPESPMFNAPEAAVVTVPRLELIKKAGKEFAEKNSIYDTLMSEICSPMIPEEQYAQIVNAGV